MPDRPTNELINLDDDDLNPAERAAKSLYLQELQSQSEDETSHRRQPQRIEVEHKAGTFTMPDGESVKRIEVVIVHSVITRGFWESPEAESPLLCSSVGGLVGRPTEDGRASHEYLRVPHPECLHCPSNVWGSARRGDGKACKELRTLLLFHPSFSGALRLSIPPTSIRAFDTYYSKMTTARRLVCGMFTEVSLSTKKAGPRVWSLFDFAPREDLAPEALQEILVLKKEYAGAVTTVDTGDYMNEGDNAKRPEPEPGSGPEPEPKQKPKLGRKRKRDDTEIPF